VSEQEQPSGRRAARVPFVVEVSVSSEHTFWTGFTFNVSTGGIFIATSRIPAMGSQIALDLVLPPDKQVWQVTGTVRWVRDERVATDDTPSGFGIQFDQLPEEAAERIKSFILTQRDSLFYDDEE
jgi:uncharacterized protein (TIGR02266 family)